MSVENTNSLQLHKGLLKALQSLLDTYHDVDASRLILGKSPLHLSSDTIATPLQMEDARDPVIAEHYPMGRRWPALRLNSVTFPVLVCVVDGEADIRIGFPRGMLSPDNVVAEDEIDPKDCCVLRLPAPSFLFLPPGVAYVSGDQSHWERPHPELAHSQTLWISLLPSEILCHLHITQGNISQPLLSLQINDAGLLDLWGLIMSELETQEMDSDHITHALFLSFLMRLRRDLGKLSSKVSNGLSFLIPAADIPPTHLPVLKHKVLRRASEYIQSNLHEALTPADIARHVGLTSTQLNRIFRAERNTTIMGYVMQRRLEMAKIYLSSHQLPVKEISSLLGYKHTAHFSRIFSAHAGMSPLKYRIHHRQDEN